MNANNRYNSTQRENKPGFKYEPFIEKDSEN